MEIKRATLENLGDESDTVVVIDVLRAFTTAAYAFD
jgi:phosphosulfolactate phosphohydrolase-like enzyme